MQCTYQKTNGDICNRKAISNRGLCILHEDWKYKTEDKTMEAFYGEISTGISDFEGCIISGIDLSNKVLPSGINCTKAKIGGGIYLSGAIIARYTAYKKGEGTQGAAWFDEAIVEGNINFDGAQVDGDVVFRASKIEGQINFNGAEVEGAVVFGAATINQDANFYGAKIKGLAVFSKAKMGASVGFDEATLGDIWFDEAIISGDASFEKVTIEDFILFDSITFAFG